jgi:glycosyltransferase involved in cell wall biosynthesis
LRVLYVVGNLGAGGLERFVTRMALHSQQRGGFQSSVLCLSERSGIFVQTLERAGIRVLEAPEGWRRSRARREELTDLIRGESVDVIHSQVNFSLWQQFAAARSAGVRVFCVTERNCYDLRGFARARRALQFHALRRQGALYTANGKAVAAHLARMVGVPPETIGVLPNGVDVTDSHPEIRGRIRSQLGWDDNTMGIGYISRMAPHKGHMTFLEALALLRPHSVNIRACLVGSGPEQAAIEERIEQLGLTKHIHLTGTVQNVDEYLQAFDLVTLLSAREGMANALLEAMAASKAIVATNVGANAELLDDGRCGVLLNIRTPESVAEQLLRMEQCPELRERMGMDARSRVEREYSVEASYQKLLTHYMRALTKIQT